jgi:transketolase
MRETLVRTLSALVEAGHDVFVLSADTGFRVFDDFRGKFPDRFLNVGICEAAMIGMAAGLAREGKQVFCYGIAPFVTFRCLEQIRVDLCYPSLPVKIVGVGAGLTYGPAGMTHHAIEDIAVMSALPGMIVVCPGDPVEMRSAIEASVALGGPCYLRAGKSGEPVLHERGLDGFALGKGIRLRAGRDVALIATGNMLATAVQAGELLAARGLAPEVISLHTVKPIDRGLIVETAARCGVLATIEEHSLIGGLGSRVADVIAEEGLPVRLRKFALPDAYAREAGSQEYFRRRYGLTAEQIAARLSA